jgi:hypothetical protein
MELTAGHDGRLAADVDDEWTRRQGKPFTLTLTGPPGGQWRTGDRGPRLQLGALGLCWDLAARQPGPGRMATSVRV